MTRDEKRLVVAMPHTVAVFERVDGSLREGQTIELTDDAPRVTEDEEQRLWIGGSHLHRGGLFSDKVEKFGSKLGGYVEHVALLRPGLLCGVGGQGEVLLDLESQAVLHRRRAREGHACSVAATADERAIFADGGPSAWVIDPAHPAGYTQLRFERASEHAPSEEGIVLVAVDHKGRALLAARDGAVAWTTSSLRRDGEAFSELAATERLPLALTADDHWMYVLRPRGRLQRISIAPLPDDGEEVAKPNSAKPNPAKRDRRGNGPKSAPEPHQPRLQELRLPREATTMAILRAPEGDNLVFGGPQNDGFLGRLWTTPIEGEDALAWEDAPLTQRPLREAPPATDATPNFAQVRHRLDEAQRRLGEIEVDDVLSGDTSHWVTAAQGSNLLERPITGIPVEEVLGGDTLLLPALIRAREGTVRPALVLWPGVPEDRDREAKPLRWLVWGDDPRGWMPLTTPEIRRQRWTRRDIFPLQACLARCPEVPGRRAKIPSRWIDAEQYEALARECKKLLKVVW